MIQLDHVGIAVKNLAVAREVYSTLLNEEPYKKEQEAGHANTLFFDTGDAKIQLLEASSDESPIRRFIEKKGEGLHHLAFKVSDLDEAISEFSLKGFTFLKEPLFESNDKKRSVYLTPKSAHGVIIELFELTD